MPSTMTQPPHSFHLPVMGTGFTIDTPLRVARYGISSVVSLVDDVLLEQMRKYHCERVGETYVEIRSRDEDSRARRTTEYLNLLDRLLTIQVKELQASPFLPGSEITRYFEMLPETPRKQAYRDMLAADDPEEKAKRQAALRLLAVPGTIDVNIMTKLDRDLYVKGEKLPPEASDAMSSLRGFAKSTLHSSIIFSAGLNPRLYSYIAQFQGFLPADDGRLKKKVVLKVSDYRSAVIQAKFLAKRGVWVSEFRVESGLNCGGHAFASTGYLLGPILEELKQKKQELIQKTHAVYTKALTGRGHTVQLEPHPIRITVQGGIGTASEDEFLLKYYQVDGTGWGTPFLLVPEIVNIDDAHLENLSAATEADVFLSDSSPLGIPFWNMNNSGSEDVRRARIDEGKPGSPCPKGFLVSNTEYTKIPICRAARAFQKRKLAELESNPPAADILPIVRERTLAKSCICHDLAGVAERAIGINPSSSPAICCGPNIVNFSKVSTLNEMLDHIYGRISLLTNPERPHMFIRELTLYVDYLRRETEEFALGLSLSKPKYFAEFKTNLFSGIEYYTLLAEQLVEAQRGRFLSSLASLRAEIEGIVLADSAPVQVEGT